MTAPLDDALHTQLRGYRREQVDEVIRVLEGRVAAHDRAIAHLRGEAHDPTLEHPDEAPGLLGPRVTAAALAPDDASQTQPGRAGRDRSTTEPSPLLWRRSDLAAPASWSRRASRSIRAATWRPT